MISTFGLITVSFLGVLWTFPFIFLTCLRVKLFKITNRNKNIVIGRAVARRSAMLVNGADPSGFFYGWLYFGYIHEVDTPNGGKNTETYILCTEIKYKELTSNGPINPKNHVKLWERGGNKFRVNYNSREIDLGDYQARPEQIAVIERISSILYEKRRAAVFVYGDSGHGKSFTALLLAKSISASICDTFDPTSPADDLRDLYAKVSPTKANPLVILLDEADIMIERIHRQTAEVSKYSFTQCTDKAGWNKLFDKIGSGYYPYLVMFLTSNKTPEEIRRGHHCSYLRQGRIDAEIML